MLFSLTTISLTSACPFLVGSLTAKKIKENYSLKNHSGYAFITLNVDRIDNFICFFNLKSFFLEQSPV